MTIQIEIMSTKLDEIKGVSKKTGNPFHIRKQQAFLHSDSSPYPEKFTISLPDDGFPYAVGMYELHDDSFEIDRAFGGLAIRPVLISVSDKLK